MPGQSTRFRGNEVNIEIDDYPMCDLCVDKLVCPQCYAHELVPRALRIHDAMGELGFMPLFVSYSGRRSVRICYASSDLFWQRQFTREMLHTQLMKEVNASKTPEDSTYIKVDRGVMVQEGHLYRHPYSVHPLGKRISVFVNLYTPGDTPFLTLNQNQLEPRILASVRLY